MKTQKLSLIEDLIFRPPLAVPWFADSFCAIPINGFWGALNIHLTTREYILTVPSWIWLRDPLTDWILFSWKMGRPWLNWDEIEKFLWTSKQMARTKLILMLASLTSSIDSVQLKSLKKNIIRLNSEKLIFFLWIFFVVKIGNWIQ